jgi:alpha-beta hydrolase superfamily lysophospholipase
VTIAAGAWSTFEAPDGVQVHYQRWLPQGPAQSIVQVAHGAAEHSGRYARFANALTARGHAVYAMDHRGHGRTRVRTMALGDAGPDGWNRTVQDEIALARLVRDAHPGARLAFFGHSLGSFMAQDLVTRAGESVDALVLSGTAYRPTPPTALLAALDEIAAKVPLAPSAFWSDRFKDYNAPFGGPTGFEWLSRDPAEVRAYVDDPLCGFAFCNEWVRDIFHGFAGMRDPTVEARLPRGLPVLVIQGEEDPIGGVQLRATRELLDRWTALGARVDERFYPGARHELLNETNREEVTQDVIQWLESALRSRQ